MEFLEPGQSSHLHRPRYLLPAGLPYLLGGCLCFLLPANLDLGDVLVVPLFELDVGVSDEFHAHLALGVGEGRHIDLDILHR